MNNVVSAVSNSGSTSLGRGGKRSVYSGFRALLLLAGSVIITGCEAKLDLSEVDVQSQRSFQRADQLQAAALSDSGEVVLVGSNGLLLTTDDGSENWVRASIESEDGSRAPSFVDVDFQGRVWTSVLLRCKLYLLGMTIVI